MKYLFCLIGLAVCCGSAAADTCFEEGERTEMLALDVKTFDLTREQGWRLIAERECYLEAASLIAEYRVNSASDRVKRDLRHHQMQMHAAAEQRDDAIWLLDDMIPDLLANENYDGVAYRQATRAFLSGDREALQRARNDLLKVPEPEGFAEAVVKYAKNYPGFEPPTWPPNLDVIDGFLNCFDKPYLEAYSVECRVSEEAEVHAQ